MRYGCRIWGEISFAPEGIGCNLWTMKRGRPQVPKVRLNLTIGGHLASAAREHANMAEMNISELVSFLLRKELADPSVGLVKKSQSITDHSDNQ